MGGEVFSTEDEFMEREYRMRAIELIYPHYKADMLYEDADLYVEAERISQYVMSGKAPNRNEEDEPFPGSTDEGLITPPAPEQKREEF